jgi:K+-sensing histidine kinase KdpD
MARKKRVKKTRRSAPRPKKTSQPRDKVKIVFNNLLFFAILTIISLVLFNVVSNNILVNLFQIMVIAFGFISVGLLIALLVLLIIRAVRKSK